MGSSYYHSPHWRALRRAALERDGSRCTVAGCRRRAAVVDHIETRPPGMPVACVADRLDNLRSLCWSHDAQVKEQRQGGNRKSGGRFTVRGCDVEGWPFDPSRR